VIFFFDNNLPPRMAPILRLMDIEAVHLQEEFPANVDDVVWMPEVGRKGYVVLTTDYKIARRASE
jgi:predicted nuclease of predicted toxin-antitoxin system